MKPQDKGIKSKKDRRLPIVCLFLRIPFTLAGLRCQRACRREKWQYSLVEAIWMSARKNVAMIFSGAGCDSE